MRSWDPACCNGLVQFNHYGGTGAFLAAALLNTVDFTPSELERVLTEHEMSTRTLSGAQGRKLAAFNEDLTVLDFVVILI